MARRKIHDEAWEDGESDGEDDDWGEEDYGLDRRDVEAGNEELDDDEPTIPCPYCRREIHEDANRCPYCEQYISREDSPPSRKPWWIVAGVTLCLYLVYRWVVG